MKGPESQESGGEGTGGTTPVGGEIGIPYGRKRTREWNWAGREPEGVAIVHDWLVNPGGAEVVLEEILRMFPRATLCSLVDVMKDSQRKFLGGRRARVSFLQKIPGIAKTYRGLLPLMPLAAESLDLKDFELVISSSHSVAKGVLTRPGSLHLCYCHSPMRYAWDMQNFYLEHHGIGDGVAGFCARALLSRIRSWDRMSSLGVDAFATNSRFVADRIWRAYRRRAQVIYPPVAPLREYPSVEKEKDLESRDGRGPYVSLSRLVAYKRVDLIVDAFRASPDRELWVIGDGPERKRLQEACPSNVRFLGRLEQGEMVRTLQRARALLFAAEEDFGIVPVEAQTLGVPVIAFGKGGARETVIDGKTGVLFEDQTTSSLLGAIGRAERLRFDEGYIREQAENFSPERFRTHFQDWVEAEWRDREKRTKESG